MRRRSDEIERPSAPNNGDTAASKESTDTYHKTCRSKHRTRDQKIALGRGGEVSGMVEKLVASSESDRAGRRMVNKVVK